MAERGNSTMDSIFNGTDEIICEALDLCRQKLKQKTTCRKLSEALPAGFEAEIVLSLFKRIVGNWQGRIPSPENWRLRRRTDFSKNSNSKRLETMLERAIAILAVADELPEWHNQIPVASGLIDGKKDKRAAVDLVRMGDDAAELVELKWKSDTPLYALFEVLLYGLVLLFSRLNAKKFRYRERPLIEARVVKLAVLAPSQYYDEYDCRKYADEVSDGLRRLCSKYRVFPEMSFHFLQFPSCFEHPFQTDDEVCELRMLGERAKSLSTDDDEVHEFRMSVKNSSNLMRLRDAMSALEPVWDS